MSDAALLEVVGCMKLMFLDAKESVMQYGDIGDNFYFILSGEVEIRIPDPSRKKKFDNLKDEIEVLTEELASIRRNLDRYKNYFHYDTSITESYDKYKDMNELY